MRQVVPVIRLVQKILGEQKPHEGIPYRLNAHCMLVNQPEGTLLYHTLTGELLLLSPDEAALLEELPGPVPPALGELAARWFLRPEGAEDMTLADQVRKIAEHFEKKKTALTEYRIFTTTDCNARCFYCYEEGWKKSSMSEQTAHDTARYIFEHCGGNPVRLHWFGGEPLVNKRAIDVISDHLRQQGAKFRSTMTSNGYLFDKPLAQRAKDFWNLQEVQITLDGTEEVYNRRKAYVNPQGSPYRRVLGNIDRLLEAGVRVNIRLNVDEDNVQDFYALADALTERFGKKEGFGVHLMEIRGYPVGMNLVNYAEEDLQACAEKLQSLRAYVERKGISARMPLKRGIAVNACRADSDSFTTVMPDGRLGRCDCCKDGAVWGDIYSNARDEEVIRQWKKRMPPEAACKTCAVYPQCLRLEKCPSVEHCSVLERAYLEDRLRRAVLWAYADWKATQRV